MEMNNIRQVNELKCSKRLRQYSHSCRGPVHWITLGQASTNQHWLPRETFKIFFYQPVNMFISAQTGTWTRDPSGTVRSWSRFRVAVRGPGGACVVYQSHVSTRQTVTLARERRRERYRFLFLNARTCLCVRVKLKDKQQVCWKMRGNFSRSYYLGRRWKITDQSR